MPLTRLTCPICLGTLKTKMPVAEGTRIRCPKCKGSFLAEAEPKAAPPEPAHEPILAEMQAPMPEPAAEEEVMEAEEALDDVPLEEVTEAPPRPRPRPRQEDDYDRARSRPARRDDEDEEEREYRFRRRPKKGGVPQWVWLVSGGVGLLLLLGCCGVGGLVVWTLWGGLSVNMDNYNKIQAHMTPAQVEAIMGAPADSGSIGGFGSEVWKSGDFFITVTFVNGKAVAKACHLSNGLGTIDRSDLLGP